MTVTTLGTFAGANDKDKSARIPAAIAALNKALAGDAASLLYLQQQAAGSATAVGKDAFRRALAIYAANSTPAALSVIAAPVHPSPTYAPPAPIPPAIPGLLAVPSEPHPIGFDYGHAPLIHPPVPVPGGVTVYGVMPGVITPVNVGSSPTNGGAITGPPAPESSSPLGPVPAAADFGYVAPGSAPLEGAPPTAPAATGALDPKMILFLVAAAALFFFVDAHRPRGK